MRNTCSALTLTRLLLLFCGTSLFADEVSEQGRQIFDKYHQAVVTIQITLKSKVTVSGVDQMKEARRDMTGTVIDPSGLTAVSLSVSDPAQFVQSLMPERDPNFKVETEVSGLKILLADGTELPAEVVRRVRDLDLALLRPKTRPATPLNYVDLRVSSKARVLDEVITLNRLGIATDRAYAASVERISAVVSQPRLFYVPMSGMTTTALGSPAFTLDGKVLGIFVVRASRETGANNQPNSQISGVILPAEDVLSAAKDAPEHAPTEAAPANK